MPKKKSPPLLKRGSLENYWASPERQNAFARMIGSELIIDVGDLITQKKRKALLDLLTKEK